MARRTILVSDVSGEEIPDDKSASVTITFRDARKGTIALDVTHAEAEHLGAQGRRRARRGRRPKQEEVPAANRPPSTASRSA